MKKLLLLSVMILIGIAVKAQEIFFPTKEGTVLVYKMFDKKDKVSSTVKYTIRHITVKGNDMDITYFVESMDTKDKLLYNDEITIHKKGDKLYFDMSNFINKAAFQQNGTMPAEIQITGNNMEIPSNPQPGDLLPDANVEMAMKLGFINMKMAAQITNRKVEAIEDVTVTAGTYKGYKFSSEINSSTMGMKMKSSNIDWYAKGIGIVKTESFDKSGKLQSHMELISLN
jgi:hypothetical protein